MRLQSGRVGQKDEGDGLGDLLGEGIVEDERIVPGFLHRHIVRALRDPVGFTLAHPFDRLETDARQLLDHRRRLIAGTGVRGCRGQVLVGIGAVGIGGRKVGTQSRSAGVFEDAEVDRFLMRLDAPRDGVAGANIDPSHEIGLADERVSRALAGEKGASHLAMDLQLLHCGHGQRKVGAERA